MTAAIQEKLAMQGRSKMSPQQELTQSLPSALEFSAALPLSFGWALNDTGKIQSMHSALERRKKLEVIWDEVLMNSTPLGPQEFQVAETSSH